MHRCCRNIHLRPGRQGTRSRAGFLCGQHPTLGKHLSAPRAAWSGRSPAATASFNIPKLATSPSLQFAVSLQATGYTLDTKHLLSNSLCKERGSSNDQDNWTIKCRVQSRAAT